MSIRDDLNKLAAAMREVGYYKKAATPEEIEAIARRAEAAEADARRYRWLRHGDNDELLIRSSHTENCGPDYCWLLRGEELDNAIDAELAKEPKP